MSVVILKWNPGFSSYTMWRFLNHLEECALKNTDASDMNWSIWDFKQVHKGDKFFMLKVGYGQIGIVAQGTITSEPYSGEDWAWRDRPTQYCDFNYEVMINPDAYPLLDSHTLAQAIPDFDWEGGHSGVVLNDEQATKLESLWHEYLQRQAECFSNASDHNLFMVTPGDPDTTLPYTIELDNNYRGNFVRIKYTEGELVHQVLIYNYERILGKFGVKSWRTLRQLFVQRYHTTDSLQTLCSDLFRHCIEFTADFYIQSDDEDEEDE